MIMEAYMQRTNWLTFRVGFCFYAAILTVICLPATPAHAAAQSLKVIYAVNAGGYEHTDLNGIHYEADPLHNKVGTASDYGNHLLIIGRVPEQDEVLYRTERYHTATFGYDVPIDGNGQYALIMKFCEVYFNEPNMKIFDVVLNNRHTVVSELDIFHQVGRGTAHEEIIFFTVADGRLYYKEEQSTVRNGYMRLEFIKGDFDNPKINAFALLKGDVANVPRLSPVSDDILPMDADMAVFHDRVSADGAGGGGSSGGKSKMPVRTSHPAEMPSRREALTPAPARHIDDDEDEDDDDELDEDVGAAAVADHGNGDEYGDIDLGDSTAQDYKTRKTSGPRHPNPYTMDDSSVMLPVFIAIGAFIPLLFCLCKL